MNWQADELPSALPDDIAPLHSKSWSKVKFIARLLCNCVQVSVVWAHIHTENNLIYEVQVKKEIHKFIKQHAA